MQEDYILWWFFQRQANKGFQGVATCEVGVISGVRYCRRQEREMLHEGGKLDKCC